MTQQDDITQRVLTDDEIRGEIHNAIGFGFEPGELQSVNAADLMNVAYALLSKLRAPVADERAAFDDFIYERVCSEQPYSHFDVWKARAALASAPVAGEAVAWKIYDAALGKHILTENPKVADMLLREGGNTVRPLVYGDAAPQASAEDVRNAALEEAAKVADQVATANADPRHPFKVCTAAQAAFGIRAIKTLADKDGGQQRAEVTEAQCFAVYQALDEFGRDIDIYEYGLPYLGDEHRQQKAVKIIRAALSAPQAEQGERDA